MMSREDLLRELELLPVWQAQHSTTATENQPVAEKAGQSVQSESVMPDSEKSNTEQPNAESQWKTRLIASESSEWVFVLSTSHDDEAEKLLQNMLKAVNVKAVQDSVVDNIAHIKQHQPKVIVVMGESEAQQLLKGNQPLEQMRGQPHSFEGVPIVVTYSPSHLLLNLADKAKAWEDLCSAKFTIANL